MSNISVDRKSPTSSAIPITPPSHTRSNTWFPLNFSMEIDENSELKIDSTNNGETTTTSPAASDASNDPTVAQSENVDEIESEETTAPVSKKILKQKDYKLSAVVCEINDSNQNQKHLVALVYVGSSYHQMKLGDTTNRPGQWYIFNDFSIAPVSVQEAVWFTLDWKQPCVLFYSCCDFSPAEVAVDQFMNPFVHVSSMNFICCTCERDFYSNIFVRRMSSVNKFARTNAMIWSLNRCPRLKCQLEDTWWLWMLSSLHWIQKKMKFVMEKRQRLNRPIWVWHGLHAYEGKCAWFFGHNSHWQNVFQINSQDPDEGVPFIDDYISTQEQVVDYLTKFSGIKPGDLDANFSNKHLTTLKNSYQKLRFLADAGVIFVGHGLSNDFR